MKIDALFPTPLLTAKLPHSEALCAGLRAAILARETQTPGVRHSNTTSWQSDDDLLAWAGVPGANLSAAVQEVIDHFTGVVREGGLTRDRVNWKINAWANINRAGDANDLHFHPGAYWSAVFYVDDGGINGGEEMGGALEFLDPRGALPLMHAPTVKMAISQCATAGLGERIYPETGMLALFPAWLGHRVTAYTGAGTRISVAMNFAA